MLLVVNDTPKLFTVWVRCEMAYVEQKSISHIFGVAPIANTLGFDDELVDRLLKLSKNAGCGPDLRFSGGEK